jgi:nucleoside-diphosphate-sugar epimerase
MVDTEVVTDSSHRARRADAHSGLRAVFVDTRTDALGSRVVALLDSGDDVDAVRFVDTVDQADVLVWLAAADPDERARQRQSAGHGLAEALSATTASHLVLVSSALVYGAWPNNPVPLTEDAVLRPEGEFDYARQLGAVEFMAEQWRRARSTRTVTVLRPAVTVAATGTGGIARALAAGMGQRRSHDDAPSQFLHLDDLASAVAIAADKHLDGVFNVAPDGWVAGERVRALAGAAPRLKLPDRAAEVLSGLRWRFQRGPIPPGLRSYTQWPWLVANDRLKAHGWRATVTNEQAYVEGTEAKWFTLISPKRRQELALGGLVTVLVGALAGTVVLVRRHRRRRMRHQ